MARRMGHLRPWLMCIILSLSLMSVLGYLWRQSIKRPQSAMYSVRAVYRRVIAEYIAFLTLAFYCKGLSP